MSAESAKELNRLWKIIDLMASDFTIIYNRTGLEVSSDDIINEYAKKCDGPTALEEVLIREGKLTTEEVCQDTLFQCLLCRINHDKNLGGTEDE